MDAALHLDGEEYLRLAGTTFTQIRTLDQNLNEIPDEELDILAQRGFTGLWLIGLWERSRASQRIKQRMGDHDAVASAYSLYSYDIAEDLGGWAALENLRWRAWQRGIRLSADMVPNHMGIDFEMGDRASRLVPVAAVFTLSHLPVPERRPL